MPVLNSKFQSYVKPHGFEIPAVGPSVKINAIRERKAARRFEPYVICSVEPSDDYVFKS